jgi:hypothetical protein
MKLISMTDFVLEQVKLLKTQENNILQFRNNITNYAYFLKQPLKLEMFVPCDEDGNVLEMPVNYEIWLKLHNNDVGGEKGTFGFLIHEEYQKAKEKVLFEGFEIATNKEGEKVILGDYTCLKVSDLENGTIEDLVKYVHIKITESAVKRIFG